MTTIAEQIQTKIASATRSAQRAEADARDVANAWRIIAERADALPLVPDQVFAGTRLHGSRVFIKFAINDATSAKDWRETTAQLMRVFKPMATRCRYKDSCLGYPPELNEKEQARADEGRANVTEIAPFIVRMTRLYSLDGQLYGTAAVVEWYSEIDGERLHVAVKIADDMQGAAESVGFVQEPTYRTATNERGGRERVGRVPIGYTPRWPFRIYKMDTFSNGYDPKQAPAVVASWCASMCWRDDAAEKFLELTAPIRES